MKEGEAGEAGEATNVFLLTAWLLMAMHCSILRPSYQSLVPVGFT